MPDVPDTPTEPDWPQYAARLEAQVAAMTVEALRLAATVDTLSAHVAELRDQLGGDDDGQ